MVQILNTRRRFGAQKYILECVSVLGTWVYGREV